MNKYVKMAGLTAKNPVLAMNKARVTVRNSFTSKWDYYLRKGYASPPTCICIKLTNACNLSCKMCGQPREGHNEGDAKYAPKEYFKQKVDVDIFKKVIDEVKGIKPNIYLWGGEPLLYKEIFNLVHYIKKCGLTAQINTNGLFLQRYAAEIVESGLDDLIISIDGPADVHDEVRGLPGAFEKVKTGLQTLEKEKQKRKIKNPLVRIRGTISPYNFEYIYSLVDITKQFHADSLNFNWTWFTTEETGQAHQRLMENVFDTRALSWIPYTEDVILDEEKRRQFRGIQEELLKFQQNGSDILITMSPHIKPDQVETYYTDIRETFGNSRCYAVWLKSYILPNGDVTPCPDFPDYITGNIKEEKFLDIWNGDRYRHWRLELKKRKLFPICYRCCDLFLSDVAIL